MQTDHCHQVGATKGKYVKENGLWYADIPAPDHSRHDKRGPNVEPEAKHAA